MAKQIPLLVRIHRAIGGVWGWLTLIIGLGMLIAGIVLLLSGKGLISQTIPQMWGLSSFHVFLLTAIAASSIGALIVALSLIPPIVHHYREKSAETQANHMIAEFDRKIARGEYKDPPPSSPLAKRLFFGVKTYPPLVSGSSKGYTSRIWSSDEEDKDAPQKAVTQPAKDISTINDSNELRLT